jgi:hypothetical protein
MRFSMIRNISTSGRMDDHKTDTLDSTEFADADTYVPQRIAVVEPSSPEPDVRIITKGNIVEHYFPKSGQSIVYVPDEYREDAVESSTDDTWTLAPMFHYKFLEGLCSCFGGGRVVYMRNINTYVAASKMYIELVRIDGKYAARFTDKYDDESDDSNYTVLAFYHLFEAYDGESYPVDRLRISLRTSVGHEETPDTFVYGSWDRKEYHPDHRYEDVTIPITSDEHIEWNAEDIMPSTSVCIYPKRDVFGTHEIMKRICNPESKIDILFEKAKSVTLCVSYWVLVDLRDKSLDFEQHECGLEDEQMPPFHPDTGLGHLVPLFRSILQKFTNLHVYFNETNMSYWEKCCFARYSGVVRTFKNISDYDYTLSDSYGELVISNIEKAYSLYGITTDRVVLLHGCDDTCNEGRSSETQRYIELAQKGMHEGDWSKLDPFTKPYIPYMRFRKLPLSAVPTAAEYPNLRCLNADVVVTDIRSILLPDCPELQWLELACYGPDYSQSPDISIHIRGCEKLKYIGIGVDRESRVNVTWEAAGI